MVVCVVCCSTASLLITDVKKIYGLLLSFVNIMLNSARFDPAGESYDFEQYGYGAEGGVPVEVKAGDVVFFNGYTLHRSLPNTTTDCYRPSTI